MYRKTHWWTQVQGIHLEVKKSFILLGQSTFSQFA